MKHILHCLKCNRWRRFTRKVVNGWEIFTCTACGEVQSYWFKEGQKACERTVETYEPSRVGG